MKTTIKELRELVHESLSSRSGLVTLVVEFTDPHAVSAALKAALAAPSLAKAGVKVTEIHAEQLYNEDE